MNNNLTSNQADLTEHREMNQVRFTPSLEKENAIDNKRETRILLKDLLQRESMSVTTKNSSLTPEDTLIRGHFFRRCFDRGLSLHYKNSKEEHAFTVDSLYEAGLSCIFSLRGQLDLSISNQKLCLKPGRKGTIGATAILRRSQQSFQRNTRQPQHLSHFLVTASPQWLTENGLEETLEKKLGSRFAKHNMAITQWSPSIQLTRLLNDIISPCALAPELLDLRLEARTLDIVAETLSMLVTPNNNILTSAKLSRHEQIRLRRARDFIISDPSQAFSVGQIAHQAGVSSSGLQRLFRRAENCSVFDYIRQVRLNQALSQLRTGTNNIQEASALAGYSSPANFATAFKKQFGITPKQAAVE